VTGQAVLPGAAGFVLSPPLRRSPCVIFLDCPSFIAKKPGYARGRL
jgi:hypothetical protein